MQDLSTIRAFIVDNDDTAQAYNRIKGYGSPEDQWLAAFNAVLTALRIPPMTDDSAIRQSLKGIDIRDVHRIQCESLGLPLSYDVWRSVLDPLLFALAPLGEMAEGFEDFVIALKTKGIPCGIASSAVSTVLARKWDRFPELRAWMQCFVAGDDSRVRRSKPEPDLLIVAASDIGMPIHRCAYVGDSKSDVIAAQRAGMLPILYRHNGRSVAGIPPGFLTISSFDELRAML